MQLGFAMLFEACRETGLANGAPIFIDLGRIRWAGFLFADILGSLVDRDWPVAQTLPHLVTVVLSHRWGFVKVLELKANCRDG